MNGNLSRRNLIGAAGATVVAPALLSAAPAARWPVVEGPNTPKLCLGGGGDEAGMRRVKQLGVDYIVGGSVGAIPWKEADLRARIERTKAAGLTHYNIMISGFTNAIYGRAGRDEDIDKVLQSIRAAGKAGLPVIEYNWYAHRAMEGYFEETGRAGSGHTGFDYEKMRGLPPLPEEGAHTAEEMWKNITYFLKAVIPVCREAGVRMALHPNDPPAPISRGSEQIMGTVAGWRKLISIVDDPANGITFDPGVTREMGEDPVEVCRYFSSRDRMNHMHYRNVRVMKPYERYTEVAVDEGQVDMFGVMKEVVRNKYTRTIYPEHPRALDYDREYAKLADRPIGGYPGGGGYAGTAFAVAYTRAMLQAAMESA
ncbi:MAG: mannonate dehydratase [Bryobacterales bacterium]|nr:mannonate dehydratase [Bryobacterales bacterium]